MRRWDWARSARRRSPARFSGCCIPAPPGRRRRRDRAPPARREPEVEIQGVGDLLSTYARCCKPVPPEPIAGYITVGRGVSIHSQSCANLARLAIKAPARVLPVSWGAKAAGSIPGGHRGPGIRPPRPGQGRERGAGRRENQHPRHDHHDRRARSPRPHADRHRCRGPASALAAARQGLEAAERRERPAQEIASGRSSCSCGE